MQHEYVVLCTTKYCPERSSMFRSLLTNSMEQGPPSDNPSDSQEIPHILRSPKGSLPYSQVPSTCPYLQPQHSSLCHSNTLLEITILYHSPNKTYIFQVVSYPKVSPPKLCVHLSSFPFVLHATPISPESPERYLTKRSSYLSAPYSRTFSAFQVCRHT